MGVQRTRAEGIGQFWVDVGAAGHRHGVAQILGGPLFGFEDRAIGIVAITRGRWPQSFDDGHVCPPGSEVPSGEVGRTLVSEVLVHIVGRHPVEFPIGPVAEDHRSAGRCTSAHVGHHLGFVDPPFLFHPRLTREAQDDVVPTDRDVLTKQRGQSVGLVVGGVLGSTDTEVGPVEQSNHQGHRTVPRPSASGQVLLHHGSQ